MKLKNILVLVLTLMLVVNSVFIGTASAAATLDAASLARMEALIGERDYDEGLGPLSASDCSETIDWLEHFYNNEVSYVTNVVDDMEQALGDNAALSAPAGLDTLITGSSDLATSVSYYLENMGDNRLRMRFALDELQDPQSQLSDMEKAELWLECEVLASKLTAWNAEAMGNQAAWTSTCEGFKTQLESPSGNVYQQLMAQASSAYGTQSTQMSAVENTKAKSDFNVVVLSDKEIGISVVEIVGKKPVRVEGADVQIWDALDESAAPSLVLSGKTDREGVIVCPIAKLKPNAYNEVCLKYFVSKNGYKSYGETRISLKGGEHVNVVLAKKSGSKPYASITCFNGEDILRSQKDITLALTRKNDHVFKFEVQVEDIPQGEKWHVSMRYGRGWGTELKTLEVTRQNNMAVFTSQWANPDVGKLPTDTQIWFYIIKNVGDMSYTTLNTKFYAQPAKAETSSKGNPIVNAFASIAKGIGDNFKWFAKSNIDITPFKVKFDAFFDPSGTVLLSIGGDLGPLHKEWKSLDQQKLDKFYKNARKKTIKKTLAFMAGAAVGSFKNGDNPFLKTVKIGISALGTVKGVYDYKTKKLSVDGMLAVKGTVSVDVSKTLWAGPIPFVLGADFSLGATLNMPAIQLNWDMKRMKFISMHINFADSTISFPFQAGLSAGIGISGVCSATFRGYFSITPMLSFRHGMQSCFAAIGLQFRVELLFVRYTLTFGEASWDLMKVGSGGPGIQENSTAGSDAVNVADLPTIAEIEAVTLRIDQAGQKVYRTVGAAPEELYATLTPENDGIDLLGGKSVEQVLASIKGTSGDLLQGYIDISVSDRVDIYYLSTELVNENGKALTKLFWNKIGYLRAKPDELNFSRGAVPIGSGQSVQDYSLTQYRRVACVAVITGEVENPESLPEAAKNQRLRVGSLTRTQTIYQAPAGKMLHMVRVQAYKASRSRQTMEDQLSLGIAFAESSAQEAITDAVTTIRRYSCKVDRAGGIEDRADQGVILSIPQGEYLREMALCVTDESFSMPMEMLPTVYFTTARTGSKEQKETPVKLYQFSSVISDKVTSIDGFFTSLRPLTNRKTLLCMERVKNKSEEYSYSLIGVVTNRQSQMNKKDYGIHTSSPAFSTTLSQTLDLDSVRYVNWVVAKQKDKTNKDKAEYQIMGARYDPKSDRFCQPFQFAVTQCFPLEYIPLYPKGEGTPQMLSIYATPTNQSASLKETSDFQLRLHVMDEAYAVDLLSADAFDPIVVPGEDATFYINVKNTGTLPINKFTVRYTAKGAAYQTWRADVEINCQKPLENKVTYYTSSDGGHTFTQSRQTDWHSAFPIDATTYEIDDGLYQTTTETTYDENGGVVGTPTKDTKYYTMLMPATTRSYNCKVRIPTSFKGTVGLHAEIIGQAGVSNPSYGMVTIENGAVKETAAELDAFNDSLDVTLYETDENHNILTTDQVRTTVTEPVLDGSGNLTYNADGSMITRTVTTRETNTYLNGVLTTSTNPTYGAGNTPVAPGTPESGPFDSVDLGTGDNDLSLEAELMYEEDIGYYISANLLGHSGIGSPTDPTTVSLLVDGNSQPVWSHQFANHVGEKFGYNLVIPLDNVLKTRGDSSAYQQLALRVSGGGELDDYDNTVLLTRDSELVITQQPLSVYAKVGKSASFTVAVKGGVLPYRYQWQKQNADGDWEDIEGATANTYTINSVSQELYGTAYRCVINDDRARLAVSGEAVLLRKSPITGDGAPVALWGGLMLVSLLALALCLRKRKATAK